MSDLLKALTNLRPDIEATCGDTYESIQVLNGVTAPDKADLMAELERLSVIESTVKDAAGFRRWRLADPDFKALLREEGGLVLALQDAIEKGDYESALTLWNDLSSANYFLSVQEKLFHPDTGKLKEFGYQDLIDYVAANPPV